jgi:uncharacterized protein (UPF0218 family)
MSEELQKANKILAVGDITAYYLLEASIMPDLIIVDHKTKRMPTPEHVRQGVGQPEYPTVEVENPSATLTERFLDTIRKALEKDGRLRIEVQGEEDLAALPAILYAPLGSAVVYGQPGEGSVLVKVTEEKKRYIKDFMDRMIVEES